MAIVFSIDKFMSENRALTNIIGNGVATVVISAWEGELDRDRLKAGLSGAVGIAEDMLQEAQQGGVRRLIFHRRQKQSAVLARIYPRGEPFWRTP